MRNMKRNQRMIHYAAEITTEPILDEWGNDTLEVKRIYGDPVELRCNVSGTAGQEEVDVFGLQTEYSRTISFARNTCPLKEGYKVWFGVEPSEPNNYVVVRVADSKHVVLVALREVSPRA